MNARVPPPPPGAPPCPPRGAPFAAPVAGAPVPLGEALRRAACRRAAAGLAARAQIATSFFIDLVTPSGVKYMSLGRWTVEQMDRLTLSEVRDLVRAAADRFPLLERACCGRLAPIHLVRPDNPLHVAGTHYIEILTHRGRGCIQPGVARGILARRLGIADLTPPAGADEDETRAFDQALADRALDRDGFPPLLCALPLPKLSRCGLVYAQRCSTIPREIGMGPLVSSLTVLSLPHMRLAGEIPASVAHLRNLRVLNLSGNHLTGPLPGSLGHAQRDLTEVDVNNNPELSGKVPRGVLVLAFIGHCHVDVRGTAITRTGVKPRRNVFYS